MNNKKTHCGAGILLVEDLFANGYKEDPEPVIILYQNRYNNKCEDLGGKVDDKDLTSKCPVAQAALREAFEESGTYIKFANTNVLGRKIKGKRTFIDKPEYRAYCVGIPSGIFNHEDAKLKLEKNKEKRFFNEMSDIKRVYVSDLENLSGKSVIDSNGESISIRSRTLLLIKQALKKDLISLVLQKPLEVKKLEDSSLILF